MSTPAGRARTVLLASPIGGGPWDRRGHSRCDTGTVKLPTGVIPLSGVDAATILATVRKHQNELINLRGGPGDYKRRVVDYQQWSNLAAQDLGRVMDSDSVERLVLTPRHWVLQQWTHTPVSGDPIALVETEALDRQRIFDALVAELTVLDTRRASLEQRLLAPDTNFYLHHDQQFDYVDWCALAGAETVCVLVPWTVVRELDKHKRAARNISVSQANATPLRRRAQLTVSRLHELFSEDSSGPVKLREGVHVELVMDDHTRQRLSDPDSEIIDRLLTAQSLLAKSIALVTGDRSMEFAARADGLATLPIPEPAPDPAATQPVGTQAGDAGATGTTRSGPSA